jgi:ribosomal protein S27AE
MNKYEKLYYAIIAHARAYPFSGYTESHHILPRCLGGSDEKSNLVDVSGQQHFICHWLLTKIHTGENRGKMVNALMMMRSESPTQQRYNTKITGRVYAKLREEQAAYISKMNTGSKLTPEQCEKVRQSKIGKKRAPFTQEWLDKIKEARQGDRNGMFGKTLSNESRKKIGDKLRGRKQTEEEKKKRGASVKARGLKREKKLCPHCGKEIACNMYTRWHGDNCKQKI